MRYRVVFTRYSLLHGIFRVIADAEADISG